MYKRQVYSICSSTIIFSIWSYYYTYSILSYFFNKVRLTCGVHTVVLDKTGTITQGRPQVTDVVVAEGQGGGPAARDGLLSLALSLEKKSEHPLARAVVERAEDAGVSPRDVEGFEQVPGQGLRGRVAGATCLAGNARMMEAAGVDVSACRERAAALADDGKTVLYFCLLYTSRCV